MAFIGSRYRQNSKEAIVMDYSRRKLLMYANSFKELANSFTENAEINGDDRQQLLESYNLMEKQQILCNHMTEVSKILSKMASEMFRFTPVPERMRRKVIAALRVEKLTVTDIFYIDSLKESPDRERAIGISIYCEKERGCSAQNLADMLSVLLDRRLSPSVVEPLHVEEEEKLFMFVEEPYFLVVPGYAKAVKEGESISGDNYSIIETAGGCLNVFLADGTGSGERACKDSERVLDLMEKMTEAGYDMDTAMHLLNNALLTMPEQNMSTLDICSLDLYSGMCRFRKAGAAATFLKSNSYVERIVMQSLPLGIFQNHDIEVITRELIENDYIIMVTDGVIEALENGGYEDLLQSYVEDLQECSPGEMAQRILQFVLRYSGGRIADDMTVIVLGVYRAR